MTNGNSILSSNTENKESIKDIITVETKSVHEDVHGSPSSAKSIELRNKLIVANMEKVMKSIGKNKKKCKKKHNCKNNRNLGSAKIDDVSINETSQVDSEVRKVQGMCIPVIT